MGVSVHRRRLVRSITSFLTLILAGILAGVLWPSTTNASPVDSTSLLKVQLKWLDQAQFAGYYVGTDQGFFNQHNLAVRTMPGSATIDPIASLANGSADVAQASMDQAQRASTDGKRYVNIAQLFQQPGSLLICRTRRGFNSANDLHGAQVIVNAGRQDLVLRTFAHIFPDGGRPVLLEPSGDDVQTLADGKADCLWGTTFNEYWRAKDLGLNIFTIAPADYGVIDIEDGLYVDEARLSSPEFRAQLVGLLEGLRDSWSWAAKHPASTAQMVAEQSPRLDVTTQRRQLESVLALLGTNFGYLDPHIYETMNALGLPSLAPELSSGLWTHEIYNQMLSDEGKSTFIAPVTAHYLADLRGSVPYLILLSFGVFAAAVSGALVALRLGYRLWGIVVLASLTALGGGVIRDVLLGGERYPSYLVHNTLDIWIVLAAVAAVSLVNHYTRRDSSVLRTEWFATNADVIGFSIIGLNGAAIAIIVGAPLIWVPISAALSVAGGGILTDVVARREHSQFRGELYEEVVVIGSLVLLGLLWLTNSAERSPGFVALAVVVALILLLGARFVVLRYRIRYPERKETKLAHSPENSERALSGSDLG